MSAKNQIKFDINKFPLLSSPSETHKAKFLKNRSSAVIVNSFQAHNNPTVTSQSSFDEPNTRSTMSYLSESNSNIPKKSNSKKSCLRAIYPQANNKNIRKFYDHFIADQIADIFLYFTLSNTSKTMTHSNFRSFVK
jgi:hypothetical protein